MDFFKQVVSYSSHEGHILSVRQSRLCHREGGKNSEKQGFFLTSKNKKLDSIWLKPENDLGNFQDSIVISHGLIILCLHSLYPLSAQSLGLCDLQQTA